MGLHIILINLAQTELALVKVEGFFGLYFAGSKDVAKFYRDKLSRSYMFFDTIHPEVKQKYKPLIEAEKLKREEANREIQGLLNDQYDVRSKARICCTKNIS